jgi:hypothetical protein
MNTTAEHGVQGCYCEDCSGNRTRTSAEPADPERRMVPVRARQRWTRVLLASDGMLRRVS